ncbi:RNA polymerase sigma factor [Psychroserpens sp. XS_ASV72]|uniref:RNA polymerase sigma factor n=1 Tax=Psychroserpens sp. XS_ASV72 TaxID=3241293 RepID=UPI00351113C8
MSKHQETICNANTFKALYQKYAKDLRRFLFFKTQDMDKAEDVLQDTFVKLWENCNKVDIEKVRSYLYTVASNTFLNVVKHEKVVRNYQENTSGQHSNESPEFIMIENEFMEKLEQTIEALPEKQKEVFLLSRIEKKTYKEIADQIGISVKAVEKRMHLALLVMREKIGDI